MDNAILQALRTTDDPAAKAALIAESFFNELPKPAALVARRCVILHWFDWPIVEALQQDAQLAESELGNIYEQLLSLPFVESLPWGLTFQDLTREGLLKRYVISQPELLKTAAAMAAPAYAACGEDEKIAAEELYCYIMAGDSESSMTLFNKLVERAISYKDWQYLENLLQLLEEAQSLPIVENSLLSEQSWMLRGLVHRVQGRSEAAIAAYSKALEINPNNTLALASRGTIYAQQRGDEKALIDYNHALQLGFMNVQVYINRGIIHARHENYTEALTDFAVAIRLDPSNAFAYSNKGNLFNDLGQHEEALAAYEEALRLDPNAVDAYEGKGNALCGLGRYEEALAAYEEALRLNPSAASAYKGKGNALYGLRCYEQAFVAYEEARRLAPDNVDVYKSRNSMPDRPEQNMEVSFAEGEYLESGSVKSLSQERSNYKVKSDGLHDIIDLEEHKQRNIPGDNIPNNRQARVRSSSSFSKKRGSKRFMPRIMQFANALAAVLVVGILLSAFILTLGSHNRTTVGSPGPTQLGSATVQSASCPTPVPTGARLNEPQRERRVQSAGCPTPVPNITTHPGSPTVPVPGCPTPTSTTVPFTPTLTTVPFTPGPTSTPVPNTLTAGQDLYAPQYLLSDRGGQYKLVMQPDGNLVLYVVSCGIAIWNSGTGGNPGAYATMQRDGNLVVYNSSRRPLWTSLTGGHPDDPGYQAVVECDGNFIVFNPSGTVIWNSQTGGHTC